MRPKWLAWMQCCKKSSKALGPKQQASKHPIPTFDIHTFDKNAFECSRVITWISRTKESVFCDSFSSILNYTDELPLFAPSYMVLVCKDKHPWLRQKHLQELTADKGFSSAWWTLDQCHPTLECMLRSPQLTVIPSGGFCPRFIWVFCSKSLGAAGQSGDGWKGKTKHFACFSDHILSILDRCGTTPKNSFPGHSFPTNPLAIIKQPYRHIIPSYFTHISPFQMHHIWLWSSLSSYLLHKLPQRTDHWSKSKAAPGKAWNDAT